MRWWRAVPIVLLTICVARASAQVVEVPTFEIARPTIEERVGAVDVTVGSDGNLLVLYVERRDNVPNATKALTRRAAPDGTPLGDPIRVDTAAHVWDLSVAAGTQGAYMAGLEVTEDRHHFHGRLL